MKKYAFPFTLAAVCFIGGYFICHGSLSNAQQESDARREHHEQIIGTMNLRLARQAAASLRGSRIEFIPGSGAPKTELEGWRPGLIVPMIPPKVVAP